MASSLLSNNMLSTTIKTSLDFFSKRRSAVKTKQNDPHLKIVYKEETSFRIRKIEVKKYEAIDQIKIIYDDNTEWTCGHDDGDKDSRSVVMTEGEYLIRVTHETLENHEKAGAMIEFETNRGRIFLYKPSEFDSVSYGDKGELSTMWAKEGYEIVTMKIRQGKLIGGEQQPVPEKDMVEHSKEWFVLAYFADKEEDELDMDENKSEEHPVSTEKNDEKKVRKRVNDTNNDISGSDKEKLNQYDEQSLQKDTNKFDNDDDGEETDYEDDYISYTHFDSKTDAFDKWKEMKDTIQQKQGRGGILIDCIQSRVIQKAGNIGSVERCREKAILRGMCIPMDEENPPVIELLSTLYQSLNNKTELLLFLFTLGLTFFNFSLDVEMSLLEGQLLTGLVTQQNTVGWRIRTTFEKLTCHYIMDCDETYLSLCQTLIITYVVGNIFKELVNIVYMQLRSLLSDTKTAKLGRDMFIHVILMDKSFFDVNLSYGNGMYAGSLHELVFDTIPSILTSSVRYIVISYHLMKIDMCLGLFCVFFITFYNLFVTSYFIRLDIERGKKERRMDIVHSKLSSDTFGMIKTVKFFARERFHIAEYNEWFESFLHNMKQGNGWYFLRSLVDESLHLIVFCGIIYYGHMTKSIEAVAIGDFTGFIILYQQLKGLYGDVRDMLVYVGREYCEVQRYNALKETKPKMVNGTKKLKNLTGEIKFQNVKFNYPSRPKDKVLKGVNLTIKPNAMTAIVGSSGAGKSTLSMLITRMYDPTAGRITIDGNDLRDMDIEYLRSNISIVDQNPQLFNRPLADNIAYGVAGDQECTDEMLTEAGDIANCDFISKFREGYYTFAGYGGSELSGGQLQRIAIARAAIRNPKILILDEATSSLDAENEKEVQNALENLMKGKTVVVIAHRLSTIRNADIIICMKNGQVCEEGTHQELMDKKGVYENLVSQQIVENKSEEETGSEHDDDLSTEDLQNEANMTNINDHMNEEIEKTKDDFSTKEGIVNGSEDTKCNIQEEPLKMDGEVNKVVDNTAIEEAEDNKSHHDIENEEEVHPMEINKNEGNTSIIINESETTVKMLQMQNLPTNTQTSIDDIQDEDGSAYLQHQNKNKQITAVVDSPTPTTVNNNNDSYISAFNKVSREQNLKNNLDTYSNSCSQEDPTIGNGIDDKYKHIQIESKDDLTVDVIKNTIRKRK